MTLSASAVPDFGPTLTHPTLYRVGLLVFNALSALESMLKLMSVCTGKQQQAI